MAEFIVLHRLGNWHILDLVEADTTDEAIELAADDLTVRDRADVTEVLSIPVEAMVTTGSDVRLTAEPF